MVRSFIEQLRRRRVFGATAIYVGFAVAFWQAADVAIPALGLPQGSLRFIVQLAIAGLPVAVLFAWAFDVTRTRPAAAPHTAQSGEGADSTPDVQADDAIGSLRRRMIEAIDQDQIVRLRYEAEILVSAYPDSVEARALLLQLHSAAVHSTALEEQRSHAMPAPDRRLVRAASWVKDHRLILGILPFVAAGTLTLATSRTGMPPAPGLGAEGELTNTPTPLPAEAQDETDLVASPALPADSALIDSSAIEVALERLLLLTDVNDPNPDSLEAAIRLGTLLLEDPSLAERTRFTVSYSVAEAELLSGNSLDACARLRDLASRLDDADPSRRAVDVLIAQQCAP